MPSATIDRMVVVRSFEPKTSGSNSRGQHQTPELRRSPVLSVRRFEFFQPIWLAIWEVSQLALSLRQPLLLKFSKRKGAVMNKTTQPPEMKTKTYVYGVDILDGDDAWALFDASANGDVETVSALLEKDRRLVNAQYWYQFPIHRAVEAGHAEVVRILLEHGADPGQSRYTYDSWDKLLAKAQQMKHVEIELLLRNFAKQRFNWGWVQPSSYVELSNWSPVLAVESGRPLAVSGRFKRGHSWALCGVHFMVFLYAGPFWGPALLFVIGH